MVAFRRQALLPLDDCPYVLQATLPHLPRSSLHRCLQRHGISRRPELGNAAPASASSEPIRCATSISTSLEPGLLKAGSIS